MGEDYEDGGVLNEHDSIDPNDNDICDFTGSVVIDAEGNVQKGTFSSEECEPFQDGNGQYDEDEKFNKIWIPLQKHYYEK